MGIPFCHLFFLFLFALVILHRIFVALPEDYLYPDAGSEDKEILK